MGDILKESSALAKYDSETNVVTLNRSALVNTIIECKHAAAASAKQTEYGSTFEMRGEGFAYRKEVRGDYQYRVEEQLSVVVTFPGNEGKIESKEIPVWGSWARGWGQLKEGDPSWEVVVGVLHEALAKPPIDFPVRGPISPHGLDSVKYPGFVYYNTLQQNSSADGFYGEGTAEVWELKRNRSLLREKWGEGLIEAKKGSIVLEGEMPRLEKEGQGPQEQVNGIKPRAEGNTNVMANIMDTGQSMF
ncbi:MAG: hypothetical protein M1504_00080 [Candidatus Marsarchaeota archaeon]|nr:hypothetical protein [Candidatus Marsarchaeota archaeon]